MVDWFSKALRAASILSLACPRSVDAQRAIPGRPSRRTFQFEALEPRLTLAAAGLVTAPQTYSGALNGKVVFTSGGHGFDWAQGANGTFTYMTDRPDYWEASGDTSDGDLVEDLGNQDQMSLYTDYLLRAGATVVPMRPVGRQVNEVVLDNDSPDVTFTGTWGNSSQTRFYDEDYGATADSVPYRFATSVTGTATATATYTPNIPAAGFYPVYSWVHWDTDRTAQTYIINHTGGATQITVDHSIVGDGWVYLGTYHFNAGKSTTGEGSVQIVNTAPVAGKSIIADAIRFGNGMGDYIQSGATAVSGQPREDENSYHWIARSIGQGATITSILGSDTNVSAPSDFAQYMYHGSFGGALYIGFHSNGGSGLPTSASRGTRGLYPTNTALRTPNQIALATLMGDQVNQDFQNLNGVFEYNWTTGTDDTDSHINFGEIDLGNNAEMDATIVEVAFHDNLQDNALLRDPKVRDQIARSVYQGTVQYFATYGSPIITNTSLPTPPTNVRVQSDASGAVTLNWSAGANTPASVNGDPATGYRVYASVDGYGFDGGRSVSGVGTTTLTITGLDPNIPYYFKVTAMNAGGESEPTEVVSALPSGGVKQVLIVNGFDRDDRTQDFKYPYTQSGYSTPDPDGLTNRVWPRYNNSHDYVVQVESAIRAARPGVHVATTSNEAVISGAVNLTDYKTVIWILGNESTVDDTFNATEQSKVTAFINAGGNLFASGSEIAWDLDSQNNGRTFYRSTLGANYVNDDAGTYNVSAAAGGIFAGLGTFNFSNGAAFSQLDGQLYDVAFPDVIAPQTGAVSALTYNGGTGGTAAIQKAGTGGKGSVVLFGFPFETITDPSLRQNTMGKILGFFGYNAALDIKTRVNGQDADTPTGPILATGSTVTLTYFVTAIGNLPVSTVVVRDDNGTIAFADDFSPTFTGGDSNANGVLDVGETWTYSATRTVTAGQRTDTGKSTGLYNGSNLSDTDPANFFGSSPGIALQVSVNGQDADAPTGPAIAAGDNAVFTYTLTNTGNIAVSTVSVTDNNGTPGNAADDFHPTFTGGDTNSNAQLDVGETWTYTSTRSATVGQFSNITSATALDSISQIASASDATNFLGVANANFNGDGFVNAADYVMWRKNSSITSGATRAQGDANGDGAVNAADYAIWRSQFGTTPAGASALSDARLAADTVGVVDVQFTRAAPNINSSDAAVSQSPTGPIDAAFLQFGLTNAAGAPRIADKRAEVQPNVKGVDWASLLSILAESRSRRASTAADTNSSSDSHSDQQSSAANSCALGKDVAEKLLVRNASK